MDIAKPAADRRSWKRPRRVVIAAAAVAVVLAGGALFGLGKAAPTAQRSELWIEAATRGDMRREIRATGTLVPRDIRWITAGVTATVQQHRGSGAGCYFPTSARTILRVSARTEAGTRPRSVAPRARQSRLRTWSAMTACGGLPGMSTWKG